jgi:hypothetical protein
MTVLALENQLSKAAKHEGQWRNSILVIALADPVDWNNVLPV